MSQTQTPSWFYYTADNQRIGPFAASVLKQFAKAGVITPDTIVENVNGRQEKAGNVRGLTFSTAVPVPTSVPGPAAVSELVPVPTPQISPPPASLPFVGAGSHAQNQASASADTPVFTLEGVGGTLHVYGNKIVISRSGRGESFLLHGLKGDKTVYFQCITGLQLKKGQGWLEDGYIQFSIQGGNESVGGIWKALTDENTVVFKKVHNELAQKIHDFIEKKIAEGHSPVPAQTPPQTSADEIMKMKGLLDSGVISQDEFDAFKKKVLGL